MITDLLAQIAIIRREVPQEEFDAEAAVETAVDSVGRGVTEEERAELERILPEWLDRAEARTDEEAIEG